MTEFYYPLLNNEVKLPLYIIGAGSKECKGHFIRKNGCPHHHIVYCTKGGGILKFGEKKYSVTEGDGFYLPPKYPHEFYPLEDIWETHWLTFDGRELDNLLSIIKLNKASFFHISEFDRIEPIFQKILYLLKTDYYDCGYQCSANLYLFLMEFNRVVNICNDTPEGQKFYQLQPVIDYIEKNYQNELKLDRLAQLAGLSPQYLCRLFKDCMNMRPFEFLAAKRIQQAKILLLEGNHTVSQVSAMVGYKDCSYFCAVFKKHETISPAEFKAIHTNI
ncbi:MAG: AraC family transcriptional regulator [Hominimerdicola sp.]